MIACLGPLLLLFPGPVACPGSGADAGSAALRPQEPAAAISQETSAGLRERLAAIRGEITSLEASSAPDEDFLKVLRPLAESIDSLLDLRERSAQTPAAESLAALVSEAQRRRDDARTALLALNPESVPLRLRQVPRSDGAPGEPGTEDLRAAVTALYDLPRQAARERSRERSREVERLSDELAATALELTRASGDLEEADLHFSALRQESPAEAEDPRAQRLQRLRQEAAERQLDLGQARVLSLQLSQGWLTSRLEAARLDDDAGRLEHQRLQTLASTAQVYLREQLVRDRSALRTELGRLESLLGGAPPAYDRIWFEARRDWLRANQRYFDLLDRKAALEARRERLQQQEQDLSDESSRFRAAYRRDGKAPSIEVVAEEIRLLQAATDLRSYRRELAELQAEQSWASAQLATALLAPADLDQGFDEREAEAELVFRAGDVGEMAGAALDWAQESLRWTRLRQDHQDLTRRKAELLQGHAALAAELTEQRRRVRVERTAILELLRRENLFLRAKSSIDIDGLRRGGSDLAKLPAWLVGAAGGVAAWAGGEGRTWPVIGMLAILAAVVGMLFPLRRWWGKRIRAAAAEAAENVEARNAVALAFLLRAGVTALVLAGLPWLAGRLLPDLSSDMHRLLESLGVLAGTLWFAKRLNTELFRPTPRSRAVLPMQPRLAAAAYRAVAFLLLFSAVVLPVRLALSSFGYQNAAVVEFLRHAFHLAVGLVAFDLLWRRRLIARLELGSDRPASRLLMRLVRLLNPLLALLVPVLVVLDLLRFDILVELLSRTGLVLLGALLGGSLLYHGANYLIGRRLRQAAEERHEETGESEAHQARLAIGRAAMLVLVVVGGGWIMSAAGWLDLTAVRGFLDVPLPFQGLELEARITWWDLLAAGFGLWFGVQVARYLRMLLGALLLPQTRLDEGLQYTITKITGYIVVGMAFYLSMTRVFSFQSLGYVIAALSVGIGFGLQEVVSNFVSGLILLFERPLKVGDTVRVGETEGEVERINIRATTVRSQNNIFILVPNKDLITQNVINYTHFDPRLRLVLKVGVAYGSDTGLVERLLLEAAREHPRVLKRPPPEVLFQGFGDSSLDFELRAWVGRPAYRFTCRSELNFAIDRVFRDNGVTIPFPQRDLHLKTVDGEAVIRHRAD